MAAVPFYSFVLALDFGMIEKRETGIRTTPEAGGFPVHLDPIEREVADAAARRRAIALCDVFVGRSDYWIDDPAPDRALINRGKSPFGEIVRA